MQGFTNPQTLNRYSYVLNNPLRYKDPSGHLTGEELNSLGIHRASTPSATWQLLRNAEVGDQLTVARNDGTVSEYKFRQEYYGDFKKGPITLRSAENNVDAEVSSVIDAPDNDLLVLSKKQPAIDPWNYQPGDPIEYEHSVNNVVNARTNYVSHVLDSPQGLLPPFSPDDDSSRPMQIIGGLVELAGGVYFYAAGIASFVGTGGGISVDVYGPLFYAGWQLIASGVNDVLGYEALYEDYPVMWS